MRLLRHIHEPLDRRESHLTPRFDMMASDPGRQDHAYFICIESPAFCIRCDTNTQLATRATRKSFACFFRVQAVANSPPRYSSSLTPYPNASVNVWLDRHDNAHSNLPSVGHLACCAMLVWLVHDRVHHCRRGLQDHSAWRRSAWKPGGK